MQVTNQVAERIIRQVNDLPNYGANTLAIEPDRAINNLLEWLEIPVRVLWSTERHRWVYTRVNSEEPPEPIPVGWEQFDSEAEEKPPSSTALNFKDAVHRERNLGLPKEAYRMPPEAVHTSLILGIFGTEVGETFVIHAANRVEGGDGRPPQASEIEGISIQRIGEDTFRIELPEHMKKAAAAEMDSNRGETRGLSGA